jgi:hypothetical protein
MKLVVRFGIHPAEIGQKKHIEIQLRTDQVNAPFASRSSWT